MAKLVPAKLNISWKHKKMTQKLKFSLLRQFKKVLCLNTFLHIFSSKLKASLILLASSSLKPSSRLWSKFSHKLSMKFIGKITLLDQLFL